MPTLLAADLSLHFLSLSLFFRVDHLTFSYHANSPWPSSSGALPATMKLAQSILVLLSAVFVVAFPIRILFTDGTPTIRAESKQALTTEKEVRPGFQQYTDRLRQSPSASSVSGEAKTTDSSHSASGTYGTFLGKFISNEDNPQEALAKSPASQRTSNPTEQIIPEVKLADLLDILDKHGPLCVAFALFILVPIAYAILELLELTIMACTQERFPRRGREPVRLVGPERRLRAWSNRQREMVVASEKRWWQSKRGR